MIRSIDWIKYKVLILVVLFAFVQSCKEKESTEKDWPQFKKDNHRSANSSVNLDLSTIGKDWVYTASQMPSPAWYGPAKEDTYANSGPLPSMRDYDLAYYPIIVGDNLYYGSTSDNAIHCLDVNTGKELWTFTTGGPIRVAPTFHSGKLYFGSDDGNAYCIKASNGKLIWNFSPTENEYKKVLNNNSLISFWPVRTGVLVENGIAYFGASLLPWKDSYFCAVDIKTGKANKEGTYIKKFTDLTLEGSMASTGTKLIQPQGRISPIFFNKIDGESKGQLAGTGGCFVLITPELNIVHSQTSREKSIMESFGNDENRISDGNDKQAQFMSFKGGKEMVVKDSMSYILTDNSISAYNRNSKKVIWTKRDYNAHRIIISGDVLYVGATDMLIAVSIKNGLPLWKTPVKGTVYALAVANNALYASTGEGHIYRFVGNKNKNELYAQNKDKPASIDKILKKKRIKNKGDLEFSIGPFIDALGPESVEIQFVSKEPMICNLTWGNDYEHQEIKEDKASTEHRIVVNNVRKNFNYQYQISYGEKHTKFYEYDNFFNFKTAEIKRPEEKSTSKLVQKINLINSSENGIAIVLGGSKEDLALELARYTPLKVLVFDKSRSDVMDYREKWQSTGFYGGKIEINYTKEYSNLPITGDIANIVIVYDTDQIHADEAIRLIKPKGNVLVLEDKNSFTNWLEDSKNIWQVDENYANGIGLLKKAPYESAGKWTHQYGLPNNSSYGGESLWGSTSTADFEIQWMGRPGPRFQTDRSGRKPSPLAVNGKMFVQGRERIIAVDAYNGSVFWSKDIPGLSRMNILRDCSNWSADDDYLYIAHKNKLLQISNEDGKIANIIPVEKSGIPRGDDWGYISLIDNKIIGSAIPKGSTYTNYYGGSGWYDSASGPLAMQVVSSLLFAREKNKKENLWAYKRSNAHIINPTITITNKQICFVESRNPNFKISKKGRANTEIFKNLYLVSLNPDTGMVNWEEPINTEPGIAAYFMAGSGGSLVIVASKEGMYYIYNYNAKNGKLVWENTLEWSSDNHGAHFSKPAIVNNRLIVKPGIFKLDTGELMKEEVPKAGHGCASYALTEQSTFYRGGSVTQYNFDTNRFSKWERLRPDCWLSTIPAQGLVLSPEAGGGCSCGNWLETSMVFSPISRAPITFVYKDEKFVDSLLIEIKVKDSLNKKVFYSLDGSMPSKNSILYKKPFIINGETSLNAIIYIEKNGKEVSFTRTKEFTRIYPKPSIVEIPQYNNAKWKFTIKPSGKIEEIHYTIDGTIPTISSPKYKEPVEFAKNTIIMAKSFWHIKDKVIESEETSYEMLVPTLKESVNIDVKPGINRNYYKDKSKKHDLPDLDKLKPINKSIVQDISISPYKNDKMFGLQFKGYIKIPEDGVYTLTSLSGEGICSIFLHGKEELKSKWGNENSKVLYLKKGLHPIRVDYLMEKMNTANKIQLEGPNMEKQLISSNLLYY